MAFPVFLLCVLDLPGQRLRLFSRVVPAEDPGDLADGVQVPGQPV